jgi:hypothetical protein
MDVRGAPAPGQVTARAVPEAVGPRTHVQEEAELLVPTLDALDLGARPHPGDAARQAIGAFEHAAESTPG